MMCGVMEREGMPFLIGGKACSITQKEKESNGTLRQLGAHVEHVWHCLFWTQIGFLRAGTREAFTPLSYITYLTLLELHISYKP